MFFNIPYPRAKSPRRILFKISGMLFLIGNFILFILTTASASTVEETSLEVGSQAHTLSESRGKSNFVQQRIMMFLEKGITLTVWRIAPIRRSLVFGIVGVILTYTFMFYGLSR
ncbi:hypothetical protein CEXT_344241 [Caerostris extrusa]|uniref:Uncharacterized protein n=1 Tax=Caerostris extrusa TaxID=172846 RepID=A0AAV4V3W4_CAEEX|nr:hypothetical protein CEXT_344241 [Caerostris extrusa]